MTELIHETGRAVDLAGDTTAMTSTGTATISVSDGQVWLDLPDRYGQVTGYNFTPDDWTRLLVSALRVTLGHRNPDGE